MVAVLAGTTVAAGCGSSSSSSTTTTSSSTSSTAQSTTSTTSTTKPVAVATTAPGSTAQAPSYEVKTGTVSGLGTVLVNGEGLTLYLFVPDKHSGKSTCYGRCALAWPPLVLPTATTEPLAGAGVNTSLLGTTDRSDGTVELTYNGWPLYTWVNDTEPGQATGQALNNDGGLWYVLSPTGQPITAH